MAKQDDTTLERSRKVMTGFKMLRAFAELQNLAQEQIGKSGTSYKQLSDTLIEHGSDSLWDAAEELLAEIRLHGRCNVSIYPMAAEHRAALSSVLEDTDSPFHAGFPDIECASIPDEPPSTWFQPALIRIHEDDSDSRYIFASLRRATIDELIDIDEIIEDAPDELAARLKDAKELVVRQIKHLVAYDVVVVPHDDTIPVQVWVDHFTYKTYPDKDEALVAVKRAMSSLPGIANPDGTPRNSMWPAPMDVGPAMDNIYKDASEGRVVELSFQCPTMSRRREVAQGGTDLRTELYHKGGLAGLQVQQPGAKPVQLLEIYRLGVLWETDQGGNPLKQCQVTIPGTVGLIGRPKKVYEIRISYPMSKAAHDFAVSRVIHHAS